MKNQTYAVKYNATPADVIANNDQTAPETYTDREAAQIEAARLQREGLAVAAWVEPVEPAKPAPVQAVIRRTFRDDDGSIVSMACNAARPLVINGWQL
jgi:hypothetical protein